MSESILLLSKDQKDLDFASEVSMKLKLSLKSTESPKEAMSIIAEGGVAFTMIDINNEQDYQAFEKEVTDTVGLFSDKINANTMHFLSKKDLSQATFLLQSPLFGSFVLKNFEESKSAGNHYARVIQAHAKEKSFGLGNFFDEGVNVQKVEFQKTTQKQEAVEVVKRFLLGAKFKPRMSVVVANAVDELLMNAMFDAPVDNLGKQVYATTARTKELILEGKSKVEMFVAYDKETIGISVVDYYGSLDRDRLLSLISKQYKEEELKVRAGVAGAGIGLSSIFNMGGSLHFSSESHEKTEVTLFFRQANNFKDFRNQFRFLSTQFYL